MGKEKKHKLDDKVHKQFQHNKYTTNESSRARALQKIFLGGENINLLCIAKGPQIKKFQF